MNKSFSPRRRFLLTAVGLSCLTALPARAASISAINPLTNDTGTQVFGVSGDGTVVVGESIGNSESGGEQAFVWTAGGGSVGLGVLPGFDLSLATGVSADGSVIVGESDSAFNDQRAVMWTNGGNITNLGVIPGDNGAYANGVSADGTTVVGNSLGPSEAGGVQAFRWTASTNMQGLGILPGANSSQAFGVSGDGSVIVGDSGNNGSSSAEAFRWTSGTGIQGLGFLTGDTRSHAFGVSIDGTTIVGESDGTSLAGGFQAFRWTAGTGMVGLGTLTSLGDTGSVAYAANTDGSVIVGMSCDSGACNTEHAFRWTGGAGMQSVAGLLTAKGVDLTGWDLTAADAVSADGNKIAGEAQLNGQEIAYLADILTGGLTTPQALVSSLNATATAQTTQTIGMMSIDVTDALAAADQALESAGAQTGLSAGDPADPFSLYAIGDIGLRQDNIGGAYGLNGTTGFLVDVTSDLTLGAGVIGSDSREGLESGDHDTQNATGASILAAYQQPDGLRLSGTAFAVYLDEDSHRAYANGAGTASSQGNTDGGGYAVAGRAGWQFTVTPRDAVTPYGELDWSQAYLGGYSETGGPFPAQFGSMTDHRLVGRLGGTVDHQLISNLTVSAGAAWGHRLSGEGGGLDASSEGFSVTAGPSAGDRDWAEGTLGADWKVTDRVSLTGSVNAHTGRTEEPQESALIGVKVRL